MMGYKIEYGKTALRTTLVDAKPFSTKGAIIRLSLLAIVLVLILAGGDFIREMFVPGDPDVTQAAFSAMMRNLSEGVSVTDAVTVFCQEIIQNANIG